MRLAMASLLLMPQVPLLFMGEEINARTPFLFFTDFHGELADAVREGRRKEFSAFPKFASDEARAKIPDPNAESTFAASKIDWDRVDGQWLARFTALLGLRAAHIVPRLKGWERGARFEATPPGGVSVDWTLADGSTLRMRANFSAEPAPSLKPGAGATLHTEGNCSAGAGLGPWSGVWTLEPAR
jgi:1,4-alpha-glucan branching enzyme